MEEREQDKRCWECKYLCEDYPSCDLTGKNVILDMSVEETLNCDAYVQMTPEDEYNNHIPKLDEKKRDEIEAGERLE